LTKKNAQWKVTESEGKAENEGILIEITKRDRGGFWLGLVE